MIMVNVCKRDVSMGLSLRDNIISALDDYAEHVLGSDFSGAINQEEAADFIMESISKRLLDTKSVPRFNCYGTENHVDLGQMEKELKKGL